MTIADDLSGNASDTQPVDDVNVGWIAVLSFIYNDFAKPRSQGFGKVCRQRDIREITLYDRSHIGETRFSSRRDALAALLGARLVSG